MGRQWPVVTRRRHGAAAAEATGRPSLPQRKVRGGESQQPAKPEAALARCSAVSPSGTLSVTRGPKRPKGTGRGLPAGAAADVTSETPGGGHGEGRRGRGKWTRFGRY